MTSKAGPPGAALRLRAEDFDDLAVISACLQDALVSVRDLAYDPGSRSFMLVANRFRWEDCGEDDGAPFERTLCGVAFGDVESAAYRGFHRGEEDRILCLLAIRPSHRAAGHDPAEEGTAGETIDFEFAGDAAIRLTAGSVDCRVRDLGEPWPTAWQPAHRLDEP